MLKAATTTLRTSLNRFARNEAGATAIEYGLITAIVAVGIVLSLTTLRDSLIALFSYLSGVFQAAI